MRKVQLFLAAAMLMSITTVAAAQDPQPQGQRQGGGRGNMTGMLLQGITLAADQQIKVDSINAKYATERRALMQEEDMEARRAKGRALMTKQSDEVKAVLTDEQKKVFEKNQADLQSRMQQGGGRPPQR